MGPRDQSLGPFVRLKCNASVIRMTAMMNTLTVSFRTCLRLFIVLAGAGFFSAGSGLASASEAGEEPTEPYRIQPGDVLGISVWKEPDLQAEVLVRPDGGISFPLTGEHKAAGQTLEMLRAAIDERLRRY